MEAVMADEGATSAFCSPMLRELAQAVTRMAEEQNSLIDEAIQEGYRTDVELQRMKAKLLAYALRCFRFESGDLTHEDVAAICLLTVQLHHAQPVITSNVRQDAIEIAARSLCCVSAEVLAPRLYAVLRHVDDAALTNAAHSVLEFIPGKPLIWRKLSASAAGFDQMSAAPLCWEADHDGNLYSFNLLTGKVLFNGAPLGCLPDDIISDRTYRQTFGDRNFEVATCGVSLRTTRPLGGVYYEFTPACSSSTAEILIVEVSELTRLQLLAGENGDWAKELPPQLRQLHSYWRDLNSGFILLHAKTFLEREVHFVLQQQEQQQQGSLSDDADGDEEEDDANGENSGCLTWICWRMPQHEWSSTEIWPKVARADSSWSALLCRQLIALSLP